MPSGSTAFAGEVYLANVDAPNVYVVGQPTSFTTPANVTITGVVAAGANDQTTPQYDVTFSGADFSAFPVGSVVGIEGSPTGTPSLEWPSLCGAWIVQASGATAITVRVASWINLASPTSYATLPTTGANAVQFSFCRFPTQAVAPNQSALFRLYDSRLGGIGNVAAKSGGVLNSSAAGIVAVGGSKSACTLGSLAAYGFSYYPIYISQGATVNTPPIDGTDTILGGARIYCSGCNDGVTANFRSRFYLLNALTLVSSGHYGTGINGVMSIMMLPANTQLGGLGRFGILAYIGGDIVAPITSIRSGAPTAGTRRP